MKKNSLKYNVLACAIGGLVIAEIMNYDGQTTIIETHQEYLELENQIESLEAENSIMKEELKSLETKIEVEELDVVTLDVLLNTDIEYLKEKESISLGQGLFYLSQEEFNLVLDKLAQMENVKEIRVAEDYWVIDEYDRRLDEVQCSKLFEVICSFKNLEVLNLRYIEHISDITPLKDMPNLKELVLVSSDVSDVTPLSGLTKLEVLDLSLNQNLTDITPISNLTSLKRLDLSFTNVLDLKPLENLTNLEELDLLGHIRGEKYPSLDSLKGLVNLTDLCVFNFEQEDISFLENMHSLRSLSLKNGNIKDLSILINCPNLVVLDLQGNNIEDINILSNLIKLKNLNLNNNSIENIEALAALKNMEVLWLNNNYIKDISSLSDLKEIYSLYLENNQITNIDVLFGMTNLKFITLLDNKIPDISLIEFLMENENVGIYSCFTGSNMTAYEDAIEAKRGLKDVDSLELNHLLEYDVRYLDEYDTVYLNEQFFDCSQTEFNMILEKLKQLPNLKNLRIMGPPCYPMYDIGIGSLETKENIQKLTDTIKELQSLETLEIVFVYLLDDSSFIYELPNLKTVNLSATGLSNEETEKINEYLKDIKSSYRK